MSTGTHQNAFQTAFPTFCIWMNRVDSGAAGILALFVFFFWAFMALDTYRPVYQSIHANDPVGYYSWIRSLLFDGDLDFENEYRYLNKHVDTHLVEWANPYETRTETGHVPNYFAIGSGLLWAPFLLAVHPFAPYLGGLQDGFSQPYHMAVFLAVSVYGLLGAWLAYYALRTWFGRGPSFLAAVGAWAASPALYYTYPNLAMAHSCSMFTTGLLLLIWARLRTRDTWWAWGLVGLALGLSALVRWQNATFALIPIVDILGAEKPGKALKLGVCTLCALAAFVPQMAGWYVVFGRILLIPQGPDFMKWTHPKILALLFSGSYGLISLTPLCGLAMLGFLTAPKELRRPYVAMGLALVFQVYVNSCRYEAGWNFGMRRMTNCTPLFAAGLAALLVRGRRVCTATTIAIAFFVVWNFLFVLQYEGLLDSLYIDRAVAAKAREQGLTEEELVKCTVLPDGEPFDFFVFSYRHAFPRGGRSPTFSQLVWDKGLVLRMVASRAFGIPPPRP